MNLTELVLGSTEAKKEAKRQEAKRRGSDSRVVRLHLASRVGHVVTCAGVVHDTGCGEKAVSALLRRLAMSGDLVKQRYGVYSVMRAPPVDVVGLHLRKQHQSGSRLVKPDEAVAEAASIPVAQAPASEPPAAFTPRPVPVRGWICPVCDRGVAPYIVRCPCKD